MGLSGGFHQGSITVVGAFALVKGKGKGVIIRGAQMALVSWWIAGSFGFGPSGL